MASCQCEGIETVFNQDEAARKLADYRRHGPAATTRMLIEAVRAAGVQDRTLLDIGGGIGAVQYGLLRAGIRTAVSVDASSAYLATARQEAQRLGLTDRISYVYGDFVGLAAEILPADIVTLDRVICCYDNMPALVSRSAERARQLYAMVYPQDAAWVRWGVRLGNMFQRLRNQAFRIFAHPTPAIEAILREHGLYRRFHRRSGFWQVAVYAR